MIFWKFLIQENMLLARFFISWTNNFVLYVMRLKKMKLTSLLAWIYHKPLAVSFFYCMYEKVLEYMFFILFCSVLELWGQGLLHIRGSASHHSLHHAQEDQRLLPLCITRLLIGQKLFNHFSKWDHCWHNT